MAQAGRERGQEGFFSLTAKLLAGRTTNPHSPVRNGFVPPSRGERKVKVNYHPRRFQGGRESQRASPTCTRDLRPPRGIGLFTLGDYQVEARMEEREGWQGRVVSLRWKVGRAAGKWNGGGRRGLKPSSRNDMSSRREGGRECAPSPQCPSETVHASLPPAQDFSVRRATHFPPPDSIPLRSPSSSSSLGWASKVGVPRKMDDCLHRGRRR